VTVWLLTFNFINFMAVFWTVFTFGGSDPALTAHGSLDLKQEIQMLHVADVQVGGHCDLNDPMMNCTFTTQCDTDKLCSKISHDHSA
jgi:hypothetical protein